MFAARCPLALVLAVGCSGAPPSTPAPPTPPALLAAINDAKTGSVKPRLGPDHHTLYFLSDRETGTTATTPALSNVWRADLAPVRWLSEL